MEKGQTFMNLLTDFAFKRLFGTEEHKKILINFLNIVFAQDGMTVTDVTYHDKEVLPRDSDGKRILYDVYCTTEGEREHIIVEMQKLPHANFENRALFYTANGIVSQGRRGAKYDVRPVYSIFLVDFRFSHMSNKILHDIRLIDVDSREIFSGTMRMLFIHLPEVKLKWEECETEYDKMLFLIKNMHKMNKQSKPYVSGEFDYIFDAAEISSLTAEDAVAYSNSHYKYEETLEVIADTARNSFLDGEKQGIEKGMKQGIEKGMKQGMEKGKEYGKLSVARKLREAGMSADFIESITGLTEY